MKKRTALWVALVGVTALFSCKKTTHTPSAGVVTMQKNTLGASGDTLLSSGKEVILADALVTIAGSATIKYVAFQVLTGISQAQISAVSIDIFQEEDLLFTASTTSINQRIDENGMYLGKAFKDVVLRIKLRATLSSGVEGIVQSSIKLFFNTRVPAQGIDETITGTAKRVFVATLPPPQQKPPANAPVITTVFQTNTLITDNAVRDLYSCTITPASYKQFAFSIKSIDQTMKNDSLRIDSLQLFIDGKKQDNVTFSVTGGAMQQTTTKSTDMVRVTYTRGVSEILITQKSVLTLKGIPRHFGVGFGNAIITTFLVDTVAVPASYNKLFFDTQFGGMSVGIGMSTTAVASTFIAWSPYVGESTSVPHIAITNYSSSDWYNGYGISLPAVQVLYTR